MISAPRICPPWICPTWGHTTWVGPGCRQVHPLRHVWRDPGGCGGWLHRRGGVGRMEPAEDSGVGRTGDVAQGGGGGHGARRRHRRGGSVVERRAATRVDHLWPRAQIRDIHRMGVAGRGAIPRPIRLPRGERVPADRAGGHADGGARAKKPDDGRRVDRPVRRVGHMRHPGPAAPDLGPAAIMGWREAPGRVVDPGPAPGRDPGPVAGAIGHPFRPDPRIPDRAVIPAHRPIAMVRQFGATGHLRHHGRQRHGGGHGWAVGHAHHGDEGRGAGGGDRHAGSVPRRRLAGAEADGLLRRDDLGQSFQDAHAGGGVGIAGGDGEAAWADQVGLAERGAEGPRFGGEDDVGLAAGKAGAQALFAEGVDVEHGGAGQRDAAAGEVEPGGGPGIGAEAHARGDGIVRRGAGPFPGLGGAEGQAAGDPGDTAHAFGGVGLLGVLRRGERHGLGGGASDGGNQQGRDQRGSQKRGRRVWAHPSLLVSGKPTEWDGIMAEGRPGRDRIVAAGHPAARVFIAWLRSNNRNSTRTARPRSDVSPGSRDSRTAAS